MTEMSRADWFASQDAAAEKALQRHPESFAVTRELAALGEDFLAQLTFESGQGHRIIVAALLARQISGLKSLALLAASGFHSEALGHQRFLMEALARITALSNEPGLLQEYLFQDVINRKRLLEDIIRFRADWPSSMDRDPPDDVLREMIKEDEALIADFETKNHRKLRDIKTFAWAGKGGVETLLWGRYPIASGVLHASPRSLDHVLITEADEIRGVHAQPQDADLDHLLLTSCKYVFVAIQAVAKAFDTEVPKQVDDLFKRFDALYDRKAVENTAK